MLESQNRQAIPEWIAAEYERVTKALNGQSTSLLGKQREDAMSSLVESGLPTTKIESWKYTNTQNLQKTNFRARASEKTSEDSAEESSKIDPTLLDKFSLPGESFKLVFVDGKLNDSLSKFTELPLGVELFWITNLSQDLEASAHFESLLTHQKQNPLKLHDNEAEEAYANLNAALAEDGLALRFGSNSSGEIPLEIIYLSTSGTSSDQASYPRLITYLAPGAKASIIESFVGIGEGRRLTNSVSKHFLSPDSQLEHIRIVAEGPQTTHVSRVEAEQEEKSKFTTFCLSLGGNLLRNEVHPRLLGSDCESNLFGLSLLKSSQHVDNATIIDHQQPNCESSELYKGIYGDSSKGIFSGTIIVRQDAQKTNAFQSNQSLLLSDNATSNARPQLKIWADDVRCSHGATVGQLDENALFYLRSRGIGKKEAQTLLMAAFVGEVVHKITTEDRRELLESLVRERLSELSPQKS